VDDLGKSKRDALIVAVPSSDALNFTGSSPQTGNLLIITSDPQETLQKVIEAAEGESDEGKKLRTSISQTLVSSTGADFSFSDRESSFEILASSLEKRFYCHKFRLRDKMLHKLPFLADGPGSGKSRFLQELPKSFAAYVKNLKQSFYINKDLPVVVGSYLKDTHAAFDDFKNTLSSALFINISFGNGSVYTSDEMQIGIQKSLCLRILYPFFAHRYPSYSYLLFDYLKKGISLPNLSFENTLDLLGKDRKCIVLGIDEVNVLHMVSKDLFKQLFSLVGSISCSHPSFFVPVLAGTVVGPMMEVVSNSMYPPLHIPLPLLSFDSCVHILSVKDQRLAEQVKTDDSLRQVVSEIGGHCRALEILYEALEKFSNKSSHHLDNIISSVVNTLSSLYPISKIPLFGKAIAYYFLSMRVVEEKKVSEFESPLTFLNLEEYGILKLHRRLDNSIRVKIPFIFVLCYLEYSDDEYSKFWVRLLISNKMYWQPWEEFNCSYMAFRLSLYAKLGISTIPIAEFLSGAKMNISEDIILKIPSIHDIKTAKISYQFPSTRQTESNIGTCVLNAPGAPFDAYVYLETTTGKLLLVQQMKLASTDSVTPQKLSNSKIADDYNKACASIDQYIPKTDNIILILGRCKGVFDTEKLPINCAVVSLNEFQEFYGEEYSLRLKN
jgi:hypothetical protein